MIRGRFRCFGNTEEELWLVLEWGRWGTTFREDFLREVTCDLRKQYVFSSMILLTIEIWRDYIQ